MLEKIANFFKGFTSISNAIVIIVILVVSMFANLSFFEMSIILLLSIIANKD